MASPTPAAGGARPRRLHGVRQLTVLSPHLDDAALSLGGTLSAFAREGGRTLITTIYTAGPRVELQPERMRTFGDYARRQQEDLLAAAHLGADVQWLGRTERIWRLHEPRLREAFHAPPTANELHELAHVHDAVLAALADPDALLLVPLGIGGHVDHVEVCVAGLMAATAPENAGRIAFYEDFYAISERLRRRHEIVRRAGDVRRRAATRAAWPAALADAVLSRVPTGPGPLSLCPPARALGWEPEVLNVDAAATAAKLAAVDAYTSQVQALGRLAARLPSVLRRQLADAGGERIWWPVLAKEER